MEDTFGSSSEQESSNYLSTVVGKLQLIESVKCSLDDEFAKERW